MVTVWSQSLSFRYGGTVGPALAGKWYRFYIKDLPLIFSAAFAILVLSLPFTSIRFVFLSAQLYGSRYTYSTFEFHRYLDYNPITGAKLQSALIAMVLLVFRTA